MHATEHSALRKERLAVRLSKDAKELCKRAADLQGQTLTDFVLQSAMETAKRTIQENEFLAMSQRARAAFVEALLHAPTTPNVKLRRAAKRHTQTFGR